MAKRHVPPPPELLDGQPKVSVGDRVDPSRYNATTHARVKVTVPCVILAIKWDPKPYWTLFKVAMDDGTSRWLHNGWFNITR